MDTLVLGCTHYPLITETLQKLLPEVRFWVDSGEAIARRTLYLLEQAGFDGDALQRFQSSGHRCLFSGPVMDDIDRFLDAVGFCRV